MSQLHSWLGPSATQAGGLRRLGAKAKAAMGQLAGFAQDAVEAGLRGKVLALVRQPRDDLARRQAGKFGAVGGCHDALAFLSAQLVRGRPHLPRRQPPVLLHAAAFRPALQAPGADPQHRAGGFQPGPCGTRDCERTRPSIANNRPFIFLQALLAKNAGQSFKTGRPMPFFRHIGPFWPGFPCAGRNDPAVPRSRAGSAPA